MGLQAQRERALIYLIQSAENVEAPVKLGVSEKPADRLSSLQCGHYERLQILAEFDGDSDTERQLHRILAPYRARGEWFRPAPIVVKIVERFFGDSDVRAKLTSLADMHPDTRDAALARAGLSLEDVLELAAEGSVDSIDDITRPIDVDARKKRRLSAFPRTRKTRKTGTLSCVSLPCMRWCCEFCRQKLKATWTEHVGSLFENQDNGVYRMHDSQWGRLYQRLRRADLEYMRLRIADRYVVYVSGCVDGAERLCPNDAAILAGRDIEAIQANKRAVSTSRGWKRPDGERSTA